MSIAESLMHSTIRIVSKDDNGETIGTGTGFFYQILCDIEKKTNVIVIVTNKHVVEQGSGVELIFNIRGKDGKPVLNDHQTFYLPKSDKLWINHPETDVDLCILPIGTLLNLAMSKNVHLLAIPFPEKIIPAAEELSKFTAIEEIVTVGYPNGIWDEVNNLPIIRKGITATHPSIDYTGKKIFLIDAGIYPGSSGSPVLLYNSTSYADSTGEIYFGDRIHLLGIVYATFNNIGTGKVYIDKENDVLFTTPNHLGLVIKAEKLKDFKPIIKQIVKKIPQGHI
ncbi:serine protease [Paenibacillus chitinolyticus]|uniref:S1 family peptidase n=1 Tax=Paenibacillus chitinolyticus TaxID=79263 RepID=UPI00386A79A6